MCGAPFEWQLEKEVELELELELECCAVNLFSALVYCSC